MQWLAKMSGKMESSCAQMVMTVTKFSKRNTVQLYDIVNARKSSSVTLENC